MPAGRLSLVFLALSFASATAQTNKGFVAATPIPIGGTPQASAVADLNHDGIPDIVVADGASSSGAIQGVAVLLGNEGGTYRAPVYYATSGAPSFVCLADVNGDGKPDIITASAGATGVATDGLVNVLLGNGDGTFKPAVKYTVPGSIAQYVYPGDFNGDGHIDLAVATQTIGNNGSQGLAILMNNGDGTFRLGQRTANVYPYGVADFNRDGKLDLVVGDFSGYFLKSLSIFYGNGNGTFTHSGPAYPISFAGFPTADVTIQDFNEDGYPDLAVVVNSTQLTVLLTNPDGSFTRAPSPAGTDGGSSITSGDFNHDGHMDVAIVTGEEESQIDVLLGHGDGTFSYRAIYGTDGAFGYGHGGITAADLNKDGYLDLVTVNNTGTVSPLYGKRGGTFNAEVSTGPGWMDSDATVVGDFNRDGLPDVAVLYSTSQYKGNSTVSVYEGTGNGHFKAAVVHYNTGTTGGAFAAGDINGDGKLDLVVAGSNTYGVPPFSVLLGNGDGTFKPARLLGSQVCALRQNQIALADINHDGKLDLVTGNGVSFGKGDGTFGPCVPFFPSGEDYFGENYFALGDFNNDGKLDLAFVSGPSGDVTVEIHLGDGNGKFNPKASFSTVLPYQADSYNTFISVGHFTSNGALGIVAGAETVDERVGPGEFQGENRGAMSILGGNGDGTLSDPVTFQLKQNLLGLAVADFNGDGLDDVAALNSGSIDDTVPVFIGQHSYLSLFTSTGTGSSKPEIDFGAGEIGLLTNNAQQIMSVADFNGDGAPDIAGLDINGLGLLLNSRGVGVSLTASPNPVPEGKNVTLTATVGASFAFAGNVSSDAAVIFYDGSTRLGSADVYDGVATITIITEKAASPGEGAGLGVGTHDITAVYSGNSNLESRRSNLVKEVVYIRPCGAGCSQK